MKNFKPYSSFSKAICEHNKKGENDIVRTKMKLITYDYNEFIFHGRDKNFYLSLQIKGCKHWRVNSGLSLNSSAYERLTFSSNLNRLLCKWFDIPKTQFIPVILSHGYLPFFGIKLDEEAFTEPSIKMDTLPSVEIHGRFPPRVVIRNIHPVYDNRSSYYRKIYGFCGNWIFIECENETADRNLVFDLTISVDKVSYSRTIFLDNCLLLKQHLKSCIYALSIVQEQMAFEIDQVKDYFLNLVSHPMEFQWEEILIDISFSRDDIDFISDDKLTFYVFETQNSKFST